MLVHFNAESAECDDCGNPRTIMHMSVRDLDCSVNLCIACFGALRKSLNHASKKLEGGAPLVMRRAQNVSPCSAGSVLGRRPTEMLDPERQK